jgi:hypothetical protein
MSSLEATVDKSPKPYQSHFQSVRPSLFFRWPTNHIFLMKWMVDLRHLWDHREISGTKQKPKWQEHKCNHSFMSAVTHKESDPSSHLNNTMLNMKCPHNMNVWRRDATWKHSSKLHWVTGSPRRQNEGFIHGQERKMEAGYHWLCLM